MNGAKLRACLTPCQKCDDTKKVIAENDIKAGNPVEFVKVENGRVTVKLLADATKVWGVSLFDVKANETVDVVFDNHVKVDAIVLPAGIVRKDLVSASEKLELDWEV